MKMHRTPKKRTSCGGGGGGGGGAARRHTRSLHRGGAPTGAMLEKIIATFLGFSNSVRLYHWRTRSFAEHKATDELYESLDKHIDRFVEVLLGRFNGAASSRIAHTKKLQITAHNYASKNEFKTETEKFRAFLNGLDHTMKKSDTDLASIRDDILADINKFMYLMTLE